MPTQLLSIGTVTTITQNVVYALPSRPATITTSVACQTSIDGTVWTAFTSGSTTTAKFIRCITGSSTVSVAEAVVGGGGGGLPADAVITNSLSLGTNPAVTGIIRLTHGDIIKSKDNVGTDTNLLSVTSGSVTVGDAGHNTNLLGGVTAQSTFTCNQSLNINAPNSSLVFNERTAPAAPGADRCSMWAQDNGSGKTQLMCRFGTGTPVQIAIEP